jgi:hypothetical protein
MISDYISPRFGMGTTHLSDLTSGRTLDNVLDGCVVRIMRVADEEHGSGAANLPAVQMRAIMQHQVGYAGLSLTAQRRIVLPEHLRMKRAARANDEHSRSTRQPSNEERTKGPASQVLESAGKRRTRE